MPVLSVTVRPFGARIHLRRRRGRVTLILSHVMTLGLVGRVGRRIGGTRGCDGGIYRNVGVRFHVVVVLVIVDVVGWSVMVNMRLTITTTEGDDRRTCCLSHTCRAAGLSAGRVMVLGSRHVIIGGGARGGCGCRRLVQTVV